MMDERLPRQFRMAQDDHRDRPTKQEDQQVSRGNGTKETAPSKKGEKEIVTDGLAAVAKAHQQNEAF